MSDVRRAALADLLSRLRRSGYRFVTPTPATHARIIARAGKSVGRDVRDVFGWSLPFEAGVIDPYLLALLREADALEEQDGMLKSRLRVSSVGDDLFLHSAYPTTQHDAVFFGPNSYRFARFIAAELLRFGAIGCLADIGCGTAVGAIAALHVTPDVGRLVLTDINQAALDFAGVNLLEACARGLLEPGAIDIRLTSGLDDVDQRIDCIIANPPYIVDPAHRAYRDGGGMHGAAVSLDWVRQAARRLERGGALLFYAGSAIVNGEDRFKAAAMDILSGFDVSYREIDPDVFGEELERDDYADVERIAVIGLVAVKR